MFIHNGEVSEEREAPAMAGDNGLYLSMARVVRFWSMRLVAYMHGKLLLLDLL